MSQIGNLCAISSSSFFQICCLWQHWFTDSATIPALQFFISGDKRLPSSSTQVCLLLPHQLGQCSQEALAGTSEIKPLTQQEALLSLSSPRQRHLYVFSLQLFYLYTCCFIPYSWSLDIWHLFLIKPVAILSHNHLSSYI